MAGDYDFLTQPGTDMINRVAQLAQTQNAVNQNKLFQGQVAASEALRQSIDPQTGQIDFDNVNRLIQRNGANPYAQQAVQNMLVARGKTIENTTNQTALQASYTKNINADIGGQDAAAIPGIIARGVQNGRYPQSVAESYLGGNMPVDGETLGERTARLSKMDALSKQAAIQNGTDSNMEAAFGKSGTVDNGPSVLPYNFNRVTGQSTPMGAPIPKGMDPATAAQTVDIYVDAQHPKVTVTKGQLAQLLGPQYLGAGAAPPVAGGAAPGGSPGGASGASPAPRPGGGPSIAGGGPTVTLPGGMKGLPSEPPLGQGQAANDAAHQGAIMAQGWITAGDAANDQRSALQQFERLLPQFSSGPASNFTKQFGALASQFGLAPPDVSKGVAAQEEASKIAFYIAQSQFRALGGTGTNMQLESAMHTSPNEFLSKMGNANVIALLKGNADAQQIKAKEWQAWRAARGDQSAQEFSTYFNQHFDPLVFQVQYLTQPQVRELVNSMSSGEKTRFQQHYNQAVALGWVPHPGGR